MIERDKLFFRIFCVAFWVMAVSNFVFDEFLPFIGEAIRNPINSVMNVLFVVLGLFCLRKRADILLIGVFVVLGVFSSIYNHVPAEYWFADLRRTVPVLMILPVVRFFFTCPDADKFRKSLDRQLFIFLAIQAFCVTWQFIKYGAGDHGGGSLGNWNSGDISLSIILLSFYFVCKNWDSENYLKSLWANRLYIFLLFPVFLNETKVSFVVLMVYFLLLFPFNRRSIGKLIIAIPFMLVIGFGLLLVYMWAIDSRDDIFSEGFVDAYLTGGSNASEIIDSAEEATDYIEELVEQVDQGEWMFLDVPRFMKVAMLVPAMQDAPGGVIVGAGMGHLADFVHPTEFTNNHIMAFFGTRMVIHYIFMPLGILGLIWAFFWYKNILTWKKRNSAMSLKIKIMLLFVILLVFFYNEYIWHYMGAIILYFICFSYTYPPSDKEIEHDESSTTAIGDSAGI